MNKVISAVKFAKLFNNPRSKLWKKYCIIENDMFNPQLYVKYGYDKINYKTIDGWMFALCDKDITDWCGLYIVYTTPNGNVELTSTINILKTISRRYKMSGLEAPWVGKSKEEYNNEREYEFSFTMYGTAVISAKSREEALDIFNDLSKLELLDYVEEIKK